MSSIEISDGLIRDVLSTAVETGCGYWLNSDCDNVTIKRNDAWGDDTRLADWAYTEVAFDFEGKHYVVTPETMKAKAPGLLNTTYPWHFSDMIGENFDAITADVVFQFTAFGEVVFG